MNETEKQDLRVIKTKRAIYDAFIQLLEEKGFASIRVQDILDTALINRKTFYKYYQDKYDLAEQVGQNFLKTFDNLVKERFMQLGNNKTLFMSMDDLYKALCDKRKEVKAIWKIQTDHLDVYKEMETRLEKVYLELAKEHSSEGNSVFQAKMFSSFVLNAYEYLLETNKEISGIELFSEFKNMFSLLRSTTYQFTK